MFGESIKVDMYIATQGNIQENVESFTYLWYTMTHDLDFKKEVTVSYCKEIQNRIMAFEC